jgi:hypothetical protein
VARERGLQTITEENDLKAYQADPSGFLWAVLEVLRHTDVFAEPDFQALIERGRLAALGQRGMIDHSDDVQKTDQAERQRAFETSEPGVGPPRSVMPGEGDSPVQEAERLTEAQERAGEAERLHPSSNPAQEGQRLAEGDEEDEEEEVDTPEEEEAETGEPTEREQAETKAAARGLEVRDYGTAGDWRVYDPATGRQVAKSRLDDPIPAGSTA